MNVKSFPFAFLEKEYVLNTTTYMHGLYFPLYAWTTYFAAKRARDRYFSYLYIFECTAYRYYGVKVYNVTSNESLRYLKMPQYKANFLVETSRISNDLSIILCSSITPLRCVG